MAQNDYDGLEHGGVLQWLDEKQTKEQFGVGMQQTRRHGIKSLSSAQMNSPLMFQGQSRSSQRPQRTRNQKNWASSGPGMQAIFLGSNQRSCGTGVFIPRMEGTDFQFSNKPGMHAIV
ncbi:hypothetical protein Pfo_006291 [Paulownia fortunei]|nr:hypothetical protein Pfo_006291 [Paulownia fortunei]